jgi:hypothetical protein
MNEASAFLVHLSVILAAAENIHGDLHGGQAGAFVQLVDDVVS